MSGSIRESAWPFKGPASSHGRGGGMAAQAHPDRRYCMRDCAEKPQQKVQRESGEQSGGHRGWMADHFFRAGQRAMLFRGESRTMLFGKGRSASGNGRAMLFGFFSGRRIFWR